MLVPFSNSSLCEHSGTVQQPHGGTQTVLLFGFYTESVHLPDCRTFNPVSGCGILRTLSGVSCKNQDRWSLYTAYKVVTLYSIQVVTLYSIQISNKIYEQSFSCKAWKKHNLYGPGIGGRINLKWILRAIRWHIWTGLIGLLTRPAADL